MSGFIHASDINFTTNLVQRHRSKSFDDLRSSRVNTPEIERFSIESCDEIPEEIQKTTDYQEGGRDQDQELNHHCQNEAEDEDEDEDDISEEQREHNRLQEEQDRLWQEDDYRLWQEYDKSLLPNSFELRSSELEEKQELATVNTLEIVNCAEIPEEIGKTDQGQELNHHCQNEADDEDDISEEQREHNRLWQEHDKRVLRLQRDMKQDRIWREHDKRLWQEHDKRVLRLQRDMEQDRIWQEHDKRLLPEHDKRVLRLKTRNGTGSSLGRTQSCFNARKI